MPTYSTLKCTICNRQKDVLTDNIRVLPGNCTITKNCGGTMIKIDEKSSHAMTLPATGVTDWYPRGTKQLPQVQTSLPDFVSMSTSSVDSLVIAIRCNKKFVKDNEIISVKFKERRVQNATANSYSFKTKTATSRIYGQDSAGKLLKFSQTAIDTNYIVVRVNGVEKTVAAGDIKDISPNLITFPSELPAGTLVSVIIYAEANDIDRIITFRSNLSLSKSEVTGAWGNITSICMYDEFGTLGTTDKATGTGWWLYTSRTVATVNPGTNLMLDSILNETADVTYFDKSGAAESSIENKSLFLFSAKPYENADRCLTFIASSANLAGDYILNPVISNPIQFLVDKSNLTELYPPIVLQPVDDALSYSSYGWADVTSSASATNTSFSTFTGKKIIGPT